MLQNLRERITLVLLILLPFHALGVTVLTRLISGAGQPPLGAVALWKETLLGVVLLLALAEIIQRKKFREVIRVDRFDICILVVAAALFIASLLAGVSLKQAAYGIRYDLIPLGAFIVLRRVSWSEWFLRRAPFVLGIAAAVAAGYALLTAVLPGGFFRALGYSDLHSLYVPGKPVAAFQHVGGTALRRLQGAMSGPNHLGLWLMMALPFVLMLRPTLKRWIAPLLLLTLLLTFSRAAWIATAIIIAVIFWPQVKRLSVMAVTILCIGVLTIALSIVMFFPSVVLRAASTQDHIARPLDAIAITIKEPLGRGLGAAGPAQNRVADACIFQPAGTDATWALPHQYLCVFVGDTKTQPLDRDCNCPLIPENWYLQLGVEGGIVAMIAFIVLIIVALRTLKTSQHSLARPLFLSLLGISVAALVLHAWEDSAVAYTVWTLLAVVLTTGGASEASRFREPVGA